jgi:RNA polymerase sigma factor (sigma-70 family)
MATRQDEELVRGCLEGDEQAWAELVERYSSLILSVPRRYGLPAAACDDVFSEVCLALVRALGALRDAKALPQWLIRTATRATWEASRRQARFASPPELPPLTGASPPVEFVSLLEEEQLVRGALAQISERCRRLLELLYFAAPTPSYDEIAQRMDMPRGSLGPTRRRCLESMRKNLSPDLGGDVSGDP